MRIAVISDLHLGANGKTDIFGHDDFEFLKFLGFLESNFERIVLLGDIWETLTAPSWGRKVEELRAAQERHRELFSRFQRPKYIYVHGNHDLVAAQVNGAPEECAMTVDGVRILFSHGHQGDGICHARKSISEMGVWAGGWLRRLGLNLAYTYFAQIERGRVGDGSDCLVRSWALSEAAHRRADIVVTGHTHVPAKSEDGSCLFLNSGSCAEGDISFLSLDTARGDYHVHQSF